jgi:hypothetical protein
MPIRPPGRPLAQMRGRGATDRRRTTIGPVAVDARRRHDPQALRCGRPPCWPATGPAPAARIKRFVSGPAGEADRWARRAPRGAESLHRSRGPTMPAGGRAVRGRGRPRGPPVSSGMRPGTAAGRVSASTSPRRKGIGVAPDPGAHPEGSILSHRGRRWALARSDAPGRGELTRDGYNPLAPPRTRARRRSRARRVPRTGDRPFPGGLRGSSRPTSWGSSHVRRYQAYRGPDGDGEILEERCSRRQNLPWPGHDRKRYVQSLRMSASVAPDAGPGRTHDRNSTERRRSRTGPGESVRRLVRVDGGRLRLRGR